MKLRGRKMRRKKSLQERQSRMTIKLPLSGRIYLRCALCKILVMNSINVDATEKQPRTFIFVSENVLPVIHGEEPPSDKKLLVLIHGSGVVRAGQWARRPIINNSLAMGTMMPYIKEAMNDNYEVMLLNTNYNTDKGRVIPGSSSPESHGRYVWKHFISEWPGKVAIVAFSAGGYVTVEMAKTCEGFIDKVFAVGFSDSIHSLRSNVSSNVRDWFIKHSKNWVSSSEPLDTPLSYFDCARVSAGTHKHGETSYYSMESIFAYFKEMEAKAQEPDFVDDPAAADETQPKTWIRRRAEQCICCVWSDRR
ncbi:cotranscriptional regulator ARB2A homolog isoform X2 [Amphiura filiformis]|uniref:cotranscriptional regulator ARB2A homolog isoform X2 n=1 Tax=Amphiura filiformis TaxID=82378 RepID=UPI003B22709B